MASSIRSLALALVALVCVAAGAAHSASAQRSPSPPGGTAMVSGRVQTLGPSKPVAVPDVMVTLHRVGPDSSGPVDSVRTNAAGAYTMRYARFGDDNAVYFAAAVFRGIAYFSAPLKSARAIGEEAEITVFDTTSRPLNLHVQGHHFVLSSPHPDGNRDVVEVWELSNDTTLTLVGRDSLTPVWTQVLPHGAVRFVGGPGDVAAAALALRGDTVVLLSAFGPGVKQLSYSYTLPASTFPFPLRIATQTSVLEVLVEEAGGQVTGSSLKSVDAATTQGRTFKRWLGQNVAAGESITITVPTTSAALRSRVLAAIATVIVVAMAFALVRAVRRRGTPLVAVVNRVSTRETVLASIATLDARKERGDPALSEAEYVEQRATLKMQLVNALAADDRAP